MSKEKIKPVVQLLVRIVAQDINKGVTVDDVQSALGDKFSVFPVEGNSLETEILAITAREVIKKHIVDPLSDIPLRMTEDIARAWETVKEPVEKMLQGRVSCCPFCGAQALSDAMHEGTKFICPVCEEKLVWVFKPDPKHAGGGRYLLVK